MQSAFPPIDIPPECRRLIHQRALFAVNTSGGKDSQAMTIMLSRIVPPDQLLLIHAPLGDIEWPGAIEHIRDTLPAGAPLILASVASGKSLLEQIEERGRFPDSRRRFCTSDHKRTPIERELRRYLKRNPHFNGRIVNCLGIRADESRNRAQRPPWSFNARNSKAGRTWFDWLPIHPLSTADVFSTIRAAGQNPHWVYDAGMTRMSCSFCILASRADLRRAAELRPLLYRTYADLERRIGHTLSPTGRPLPEITGITVTPSPSCDRNGRPEGKGKLLSNELTGARPSAGR